MNVRELIIKLQSLPQDSMVVVSGYEGGCNEVTSVVETMIELNANNSWYYGTHEEDTDKADTPAVFLG